MCVSLGTHPSHTHAFKILRSRVLIPHRCSSEPSHLFAQTTPPHRLPSVYIQVCSPEGRVRLRRMLAALQPHSNGQPAQPGMMAAPLHHGNAQEQQEQQGSLQQQQSVFADRAGPQQPGSAETPVLGISVKANDHPPPITSHIETQPVTSDTESFTPPGLRPLGSCPINGPPVNASMAGTTGFWHAFGSSIHILCLSEAKHALMAQSLVGVPGTMTLVCNLSTTVDFGFDTSQVEHVSNICILCIG